MREADFPKPREKGELLPLWDCASQTECIPGPLSFFQLCLLVIPSSSSECIKPFVGRFLLFETCIYLVNKKTALGMALIILVIPAHSSSLRQLQVLLFLHKKSSADPRNPPSTPFEFEAHTPRHTPLKTPWVA